MIMMNKRNLFYGSVVGLYVFLIYSNKKDTNMCLGLTVLALAIIHFGGQCVGSIEKYSNYMSSASEEKMGPYDGVVLGSQKSLHQLQKPEDIYTLFGTPTSLEDKTTVYDPHSYNYPSVDGTETAPKSLFSFAFNKSSPACCPSTYTTDTGCVCTTEQQRKHIGQRGGNRKGLPTEF